MEVLRKYAQDYSKRTPSEHALMVLVQHGNPSAKALLSTESELSKLLVDRINEKIFFF